MIAAYLEELAGTLRFDPALARRVAREVEDHLRESIAADPARDPREAERRAVAHFGAPRALAAQFAVISLARRARRVGVAVVLAILAVLVAMKARVAWYATMEWTMSEEVRPLAAIVLTVDRYAFWLAAILGIGTLLYVASRVAGASHAACRRRHRRAVLLCAAATGALAVSVTGDGVLTALLLGGIELSVHSAVPVVSLAVEIACVGAVIVMIATAIRRAGWIEAALKP